MTNKVPCRHGCENGNLASRYPIICIMAIGARRGQHAPLRMSMVGVAICKECREKTFVQDFLLPEGRARIAAALRALGKAPPDFDNAWLEWGRVGDRQWIETIEVSGRGETRQ